MTAMATALALPTPDILPPAGEVLAPESQPVAEYHGALLQAARNLRKSLYQIAYYGFRQRLSEGWVAFGFEPGPRGEDAYRESLGIPRSTYYKFVRIGQSLHQLPLAELEKIPVTNAELLIQVDPSIIHDFSWVLEAKTMEPAKLAELVTSRNKAAGSDREPMVALNVRLPFLAKRAIEEMLEAYQHRHELSSKGQALELMVADRQHDQSLLAFVDQARKLLGGVIKSMERRGGPESEEKVWVALAQEVLNEGYSQAIQAAREKSYRDKKNGGRP
jgi:hypothetical protein